MGAGGVVASMENTSETWLDDVMSCLSNETRRGILAAVRATDPGTGVNEGVLVQRTVDVSAVSTRHVHLPMLEAVGLIEWDRGDGVIARGGRFDEAIPLLDAIGTSGPN